MKKSRYIFPLCLSLLLPLSAFAASEKLDIDQSSSSLTWTGSKVTGSHTGTLGISDGYVEIKDGAPVGGQIEFDMQEIQNSDLEDPEYKAKLENHLKSDDFFSVESFPKTTFKLESVTPVENKKNTYTMNGLLTIKGISKPLSFESVITEDEKAYNAKADLSFDRTMWDIKYNSGKFFSLANLGDKLIYDEIKVEFNVKAPKS